MSHRLDATVGDDGHAKAPGIFCHLVHGGPLRPPTRHNCKRRQRSESQDKTLIIAGDVAVATQNRKITGMTESSLWAAVATGNHETVHREPKL